MVELIRLLNKISTDGNLNAFMEDDNMEDDNFNVVCEKYFNEFKVVYQRIGRHEYSEIARYIDEELQNDAMGVLNSNMYGVLEWAKKNRYNEDSPETEDGRCYKNLFKLYDHIKLEIQRSSGIKLVNEMISHLESKKAEAQKLISEAKSTVDDHELKIKHLTEQLIAIIGIFAGIVVAFSFSISNIGEALSNLSANNALDLVMLIFALGAVFITALAVLMYFVAKLAGSRAEGKAPWVMYGVSVGVLVLSTLICLWSR